MIKVYEDPEQRQTKEALLNFENIKSIIKPEYTLEKQSVFNHFIKEGKVFVDIYKTTTETKKNWFSNGTHQVVSRRRIADLVWQDHWGVYIHVEKNTDQVWDLAKLLEKKGYRVSIFVKDKED